MCKPTLQDIEYLYFTKVNFTYYNRTPIVNMSEAPTNLLSGIVSSRSTIQEA